MSRLKEIEQHVRSLSRTERANLSLLATPRIVDPYFKHIPHATQQVFLSLNAQMEVLFGGAAGGGKSDALLMAALQYVDVPGYAALLLRKTWPDLVLPGAIMDRAATWLSGTPAHPRDGGRVWVFPSGARLQFGYLQHDKDKYRYQSSEFQFIGFDELTQWPEESTYDYLFSRLRKPALACLNCGTTLLRYRDRTDSDIRYKHKTRIGRKACKVVFPDPKTLAQYPPAPDGTTVFDVPIRMRGATNPGGLGSPWVRARFIDPRTRKAGSIFVPSKLSDNPSIDEDQYTESLSHLNPVDKARLLEGDWDIQEPGDMFDRADFVFVDRAPANIVDTVRYWDMAASENQGDYTSGTLAGITDDGLFVIMDIVRRQKRPHEVERAVSNTAKVDTLDVPIRMEQEPGSSGVAVIDHYRRNVLPGYVFEGVRSTGSKQARASALASYVRAQKVLVVVNRWNRAFLDEMEQFPNGAHDDQVDSTSGAFNFLAFGKRARLIV